MFRKLLFSALSALVLAGGLLLASAIPGDAAPVMMSPALHVQADNNVTNVARNCGPWNNWCGRSGRRGGNFQNCGRWNNWCGRGRGNFQNCGRWNNWCGRGNRGRGGNQACITLGGVRFCMNGGGTRCRWHNGRRYCNNGPGPGARGQCISLNGHRYCTYKHRGDCVRVNRRTYCRF